jgi:glycosyltransferase involved in cell wall biosynthesis
MPSGLSTTFILPNGFDLGGVTTWSVEMAERLARSGRQISLVRHVDRYAGQGTMVASGVDLIDCPHPLHPNNWYLFRKDIEAYVHTYRRLLPSVIVPNYSFGSYAACACLAAETADTIRVIGMVHTDNIEYYEWLIRFESIIHKFIAVSREIAEKTAVFLPHRQHDILQRPYGVSVNDSLLRSYTASSRPLQLMYAGRLTERQKHVSDLVKLAAELEKRGVQFVLNIYGSGRDRHYLENLIAAQVEAVRHRIRLAGHIPPGILATYYRMADVFVLVSDYEGTSLSMLESMAHGCVPVVTRVSGTGEVIADGVNGFTVPVGDVHGMAEIIASLDQHRHQLQNLGSRAHSTIRDRYAYAQYIPWFSDILDNVWEQSPRPWQRGTSFRFHFPFRQFFKEAGYTLAAKPGLEWLYTLRKPLRKMIG